MIRRMVLAALLGAALLMVGSGAGALPSHGSQDLLPVGDAPGGGWTSGIQANGTVYSVGVVHLAGALPDTTYQVVRKLHSNGQGCTSFFANFTLPGVSLTTGPTGNATAAGMVPSSLVDGFPFLHGLLVGQVIEVHGPGNVVSYTTECTEFTMH